mmetsp:Transcript_33852/g.74544  ORF Transcript_33852/g.74544 Transcript_33852/m.74544 type:complete len:209 (-) Transcript_33852:899-1525(-)
MALTEVNMRASGGDAISSMSDPILSADFRGVRRAEAGPDGAVGRIVSCSTCSDSDLVRLVTSQTLSSSTGISPLGMPICARSRGCSSSTRESLVTPAARMSGRWRCIPKLVSHPHSLRHSAASTAPPPATPASALPVRAPDPPAPASASGDRATACACSCSGPLRLRARVKSEKLCAAKGLRLFCPCTPCAPCAPCGLRCTASFCPCP